MLYYHIMRIQASSDLLRSSAVNIRNDSLLKYALTKCHEHISHS